MIPAAPQIVSVKPGINSITLSWKPNGIAIRYILQYSSDNGSSWLTHSEPRTTSATVTNLSPLSFYVFRVAAVGRGYTTSFSAQTSPVLPLSTTPSAPLNLKLTVQSRKLLLTWNKPLNTGASNITEYSMEYSANGGSTWTTINGILPTPVLSYTISNLTNGTTYIVRIRAKNDSGFSSYTTSSATLVFGPPTVPRNLNGTPVVTGGAINIRFAEPLNHNGKLITQYRIRYAGFKTLKEAQDYNIFVNQATVVTLPNPYNTINPEAIINTTISNLTNGLFYTFVVRAVNALPLSESTVSNFSNKFIIRPRTTPQAPTKLTITSVGDQSVTLSWAAPTNTGGMPILDYSIEYSSNNNWIRYNDEYSAKTSATITNLTNGTPYKFRVAAVNNVGRGEYSVPSIPATPGSPPISAPTNVIAVGKDAGLVYPIFLSWTPPVNTGGLPVEYYTIEYKNNEAPFWQLWQEPQRVDNGITETFENLPVKVFTHLGTYVPLGSPMYIGETIYRVRAHNITGSGPWSEPSEPAGTIGQIPAAPSNVRATAYHSRAVISWDGPDQTDGLAPWSLDANYLSKINKFRVQKSIDNGLTWTELPEIIPDQYYGTPQYQICSVYHWFGYPENFFYLAGSYDVPWIDNDDWADTCWLGGHLQNNVQHIFRVSAENVYGRSAWVTSNPVTPEDFPSNGDILIDNKVMLENIKTAAFTITPAAVWERRFLEASARLSKFIRLRPGVINYLRQFDPALYDFNGVRVGISFDYNEGVQWVAYAGPAAGVTFEVGAPPADNDPGSDDIFTPTASLEFHSTSMFVTINLAYADEYTHENWIDIITHELCHGLGVGIWFKQPRCRLAELKPPDCFGTDPYNDQTLNWLWGIYNQHAQAAYNNITQLNLDVIPLPQSNDVLNNDSAHWSTKARIWQYPQYLGGGPAILHPGLKNELMIPYAPNPGQKHILSSLTIKNLVDIGYIERNPGANEGIPIINTSTTTALHMDSEDHESRRLMCNCDDHKKQVEIITIEKPIIE